MMSDNAIPAKGKRIEEFVFLKVPRILAGILFFIAAAINIVNVIARYVFSAPVFWAEEILVFIVIWTVFLVAGSITYRGAHLNMDLLYARLKSPWKQIVNVAIALTLIGCTTFTVAQSWRVVALHYRNGGVTASTDIPLVIPHTALLFGFAFMALAAIVRFRSYASGKFD
jgi:TRAP-type C4-dicarboxylate transport system permease small subunit